MNKRQRKKFLQREDECAMKSNYRSLNNFEFIFYAQDINRELKQGKKITHATLDYVFTYGYIKSCRAGMKKIATINSKGYWHRCNHWNKNMRGAIL